MFLVLVLNSLHQYTIIGPNGVEVSCSRIIVSMLNDTLALTIDFVQEGGLGYPCLSDNMAIAGGCFSGFKTRYTCCCNKFSEWVHWFWLAFPDLESYWRCRQVLFCVHARWLLHQTLPVIVYYTIYHSVYVPFQTSALFFRPNHMLSFHSSEAILLLIHTVGETSVLPYS